MQINVYNQFHPNFGKDENWKHNNKYGKEKTNKLQYMLI